MREIKFRVWNGKRMIANDFDIEDVMSGILMFHLSQDWMQFTGLKDKDGVEIYEGDKVECTFSEPEKEVAIYEVFFDQEEAMFKLRNDNGYCMLTHRTISLKIIGHIHE